MPIANDLKEQLLPSLTGKPETSSRDMMGTTAFLVRGRMFAYWMPDGIAVKTPHDGHADFVAKLHSTAFQGPAGGGSGEWMRVPVTSENIEDVRRAIDGAREYVAGAAKQTSKRKKRR